MKLSRLKITAIPNDDAFKFVGITASDQMKSMKWEQAQIQSKSNYAHDEERYGSEIRSEYNH